MIIVLLGQIFVQGIVLLSGFVGNGLLVVVVGFVLGRLFQFVQLGMIYGLFGMEMLLKIGDKKIEEYLQKGRTDILFELLQLDVKRVKIEIEVKQRLKNVDYFLVKFFGLKREIFNQFN